MEEKSMCTVDKFEMSAAEAFDEYSDMVYRVAFARTGNKSDSDDILQEVFLRYIKSRKKPESREHLKALLIRITVNCSNSRFKNAFIRKTVPLDTLEQLGTSDNTGETMDAVLKLPLKYRTVIHLYYYCGYSVEEISEILKTKPSTVKSRLMRARDKLKQELEGVDF